MLMPVPTLPKFAVNVKDEAQKIVHVLANVMKIDANSPCFCGAGKLYGDCCKHAPADKLVITEKEFKAAIRYRESQGGPITAVPIGILNQLLRKGISKLPCLYPGCNDKPVACHLFPENELRSAFGSHCLSYELQDGSVQGTFVRKGVRRVSTMPAFCSSHDSALFKTTDAWNGDISPEQQFLLTLKAVAFALRRIQIMLALDSQVEIFRPVLLAQSDRTAPGQNHRIDIHHLSEQYQRFCTTYAAFQNAVAVLENEDWHSFSYFHRCMPHDAKLFYSGFVNPPHDLRKNRLNTRQQPIHFTINVLLRDGVLHAFFACPEESKAAYAPFFAQLMDTGDANFKAAINSIITGQPEGLLLPDGLSASVLDLGRIEAMRRSIKECLQVSGGRVLDLTDVSRSIRFI